MDIEIYEGKQITLEDGWFVVEVNEQMVRDRTLNGLKRKLAKLKTPIDALEISGYGIHKPDRVIVVIDSVMGRFRDATTGRLLNPYATLLPYTHELEEALNKIAEKQSALDKEWDKFTSYDKRLRS